MVAAGAGTIREVIDQPGDTPHGRVRTRIRRLGRRVIQALPVGRDAATRIGRTLVHSRRPDGAPYPRSYVNAPRPRPIDPTWPTTPDVPDANRQIASRFDGGRSAITFDIDLFEALNAEYASRPLVPVARANDVTGMTERGTRRLTEIHNAIDLAEKRVLEFGCGGGYEVWLLSHHLGADAHGIDIVERASWASLRDERTHLTMADVAADRPYGPDMFDRIISSSVFEHVVHPGAAFAELYRILRPGGLAWISANLYRGPMASHRYREVYFPFPHLLFPDAVFREFYTRRGRPGVQAAWVNRLSWADYEALLTRVGFRIRSLRFSERPLDVAFYARFEAELGRYPRRDLERDFFRVVLEKP